LQDNASFHRATNFFILLKTSAYFVGQAFASKDAGVGKIGVRSTKKIIAGGGKTVSLQKEAFRGGKNSVGFTISNKCF